MSPFETRKIAQPLDCLGDYLPSSSGHRLEAVGKLVLRNPLENTLATLSRSVRALLLEVNQSSFGKGPTPEAKRKPPVHPEEPGMRRVQPKRQMAITRQPKPNMRLTLGT